MRSSVSLARPVLLREHVEPVERGARGELARLVLLDLLAVVGLDPEQADHERQAQPLDDERDQDHDRT